MIINRIYKIVRSVPRGLLSLLALAVVLWLTLFYTPDPNDLPKEMIFEGVDKVVHFLMFFGFAVALSLDVTARLPREAYHKSLLINILIVAAGFFLGGATELIQHYAVDGREWEIEDMLADSLGVIAGWFLIRVCWQRSHI